MRLNLIIFGLFLRDVKHILCVTRFKVLHLTHIESSNYENGVSLDQ